MTEPAYAKLPHAPTMRYRLLLGRWQALGLALILLVPLLALMRVFGDRIAAYELSQPDLHLEISYPTLFRYRMVYPLILTTTNRSDESIPTLSVAVSRDYIEQFSNVVFTPTVDHISADDYVVELHDIAPGESATVYIELRGERFWTHHGRLRIHAAGLEALETELTTLVLP